ncbi:ribonuclease HI [Pseudobutyrivibrio sp. YE44]|uniref:ribonuclease H1 domain-containing protein n=1 Tax=Pseudobutyrivibrio sp. YE44 TaxID=1520802 RepID=UPI000891103E|nr:ribonuclease H family protein [Pseudobutyrivibrio sp. YE44]SDB26167.1 ribonuclease HI [Pseudobutyrivibrio sp. YE44]
MAKKNFYAVRVGKTPGIYKTWPECQANTSGFPGAVFKGFETLAEAEAFMAGVAENASVNAVSPNKEDGVTNLPEIYAFTDGSYNIATGVYGFGGFLHYSNSEDDVEIRGNGNDPEEAVSRNVAGEVHGAVAAMHKAVELGLTEMTLFYDYEGVEKWPTGMWKTNKKISKFYVEEYMQLRDKLKVNFVHVKAHTGIPGNEAADRMAKEEVGIE